MSAFQFPPKQVVTITSWTALVNAREQYDEFPVTYPFGGPAPDYLSIGAVSKAWAGRDAVNPQQPSGIPLLHSSRLHRFGTANQSNDLGI